MNKPLPEAINYQGYEIRPNPIKVIIKDAERWNVQFEIWEHKGSESVFYSFYDKAIFESKEEAIKRCFLIGKHIIDKEPQKLVKK